jgi:hypothetical protein
MIAISQWKYHCLMFLKEWTQMNHSYPIRASDADFTAVDNNNNNNNKKTFTKIINKINDRLYTMQGFVHMSYWRSLCLQDQ